MSSTSGRCVLCDSKLGEGNAVATSEHVLGAWLARRLAGPKMQMGTRRQQYGAIRIDCCESCNGGVMRRLEADMAAVFDSQGTAALEAMPPERWIAWASKAMHGLLVEELRLRKIPWQSPIVLPSPAEEVRQLAHWHRAVFQAALLGRIESGATKINYSQMIMNTSCRWKLYNAPPWHRQAAARRSAPYCPREC